MTKVVNTTFHNTEQINSLFTTLIGKLFDFSELSQIVNTRHDIVHRDGKTISGEEIYISSEVFVEVVDIILRAVTRLQREIEAIGIK